MMKFGRNQIIVIGASAVVIAAGALGAGMMEVASAKEFLGFLSDFGKWAIGFATVGSAGIKVAGIIKNGKQPAK